MLDLTIVADQFFVSSRNIVATLEAAALAAVGGMADFPGLQFLDLKSAFPSVSQEVAMWVLEAAGVPE